MSVNAIVFDAYGTLYDPQSVADAVSRQVPAHADIITQVWRLKQLEYTWLRAAMGQYRDFAAVTRESLAFAVKPFADLAEADLDCLADAYTRLTPYPDAAAALATLRQRGLRLAILSNGTQAMLDALVDGSALNGLLDRVISVDPAATYKPDPRAYALAEQALGAEAKDMLFVSSNGFDVSGAKAFGFHVAWIRRSTPAAAAASLYGLLRQQEECLGQAPDHTLDSLTDLAGLKGVAGPI